MATAGVLVDVADDPAGAGGRGVEETTGGVVGVVGAVGAGVAATGGVGAGCEVVRGQLAKLDEGTKTLCPEGVRHCVPSGTNCTLELPEGNPCGHTTEPP